GLAGGAEARPQQLAADPLALAARLDADAGEVPVRPGRRLRAHHLDGAAVGEERHGRGAEPQGRQRERAERRRDAHRGPARRQPARGADDRLLRAPDVGRRHLEAEAEEPRHHVPAPVGVGEEPRPGRVVLERAREHGARLAVARAVEADDVHLAATVTGAAPAGRRQAALLSMILNFRAPRGAATSTTSPFWRPMIALPTGDSFESLFSAGFASAEPTMWYSNVFPCCMSRRRTCEPIETASFEISFFVITRAERRRSSSCAILCSSIACSFFASSYSAFSAMSPNSRATRIRSATSRRFSFRRTSISCWSFLNPSGVRMT